MKSLDCGHDIEVFFCKAYSGHDIEVFFCKAYSGRDIEVFFCKAYSSAPDKNWCNRVFNSLIFN